MSYGRVKTPKFFCDNIAWFGSRALNMATNWTQIWGSLNVGSTLYDLIDHDPQNQCSINNYTGSLPTTFCFNMAVSGSVAFDYAAVMNHNLVAAGGMVRCAAIPDPDKYGDSGAMVDTGMTAASTPLFVDSNENLEVGDRILIDEEVMLIASFVTGNEWTVTRAQWGTTGAIHSIGDKIYFLPASKSTVFDQPGGVAPLSSQTWNPDSGETVDTGGGNIAAATITIPVTDDSKFVKWQYIEVETVNDPECLLIIGKVGGDLICLRGMQGTTAATIEDGASINYFRTVVPTTVGDILWTFTEQDSEQYWIVEFLPYQASSWAADLTIGSIQMGESFEMPFSSDQSNFRGQDFSGIVVKETPGGKRFGFSNWTRGNDGTSGGNYISFRYGTGLRQASGREIWKMNWPWITDSDVWPSNMASPGGDSFFHDVVNKVNLNHIPFIFTTDKDATIEGDYLFARFAESMFSTSGLAWQVVTAEITLEQEF
jgi:hypothetical protein